MKVTNPKAVNSDRRLFYSLPYFGFHTLVSALHCFSLARFVASMAKAGLKHRTMKVYLSAFRFLHIAEGGEDPFLPVLHWLWYILQGIKFKRASIVGKGL